MGVLVGVRVRVGVIQQCAGGKPLTARLLRKYSPPRVQLKNFADRTSGARAARRSLRPSLRGTVGR
jgi:hypothetical protein